MGKGGRPLGSAGLLPGAERLALSVLRQALDDYQAGNLGAGLWLSSDHGLTWARAAGLDGEHDWCDVLAYRGLAIDGAYDPALDGDLPMEQDASSSRTYKVLLRFKGTGENRLVVSSLVTAAAACGGDIAAAVAELRGTAAGERLRAWLVGE